MKAIFIDVDNTLLSFDNYVRETMKTGFAHFGLPAYEEFMFDVFHRENDMLWEQIEQGTLSFPELQKVRWNNIFRALGIAFDGPAFEKYFRSQLYDSAIPEEGAYAMLEGLKGRAILCAASNGPYAQQLHRLEIADMKKYFSFFCISEKIGVAKPSKEFFDAGFAQLNTDRKPPIRPEETVIIGDSLSSDIAGGLQYGMRTVYYRRKGKPEASETVDIVTDDLSKVPTLLDLLNDF